MTARPLVTFICVSMNHEKYIKQSVTSIVNQTYPNIEILYLDNFSSDNSFVIADKILLDSKRSYKAYKRERSYPFPQNLNFLIPQAKGDYITITSCDDWAKPEFIEELANYFEKHSHFGMVYCEGWYFYEDENKYKRAPNKRFVSGKIFDHIFLYGIPMPHGLMVKKEVFDKIGLYDEKVSIEDYDFWLRVTKNYEVGFLNKPLVYYRRHAASMTAVNLQQGNSDIKDYLMIAENYNTHRLYKTVCRRLRKRSIYGYYLKGKYADALSLVGKDFRPEKFYFSMLIKIPYRFLKDFLQHKKR